jgi:hypothetical protein
VAVGIRAYASLIDDPGVEIERTVVERLEVQTPFAVEFARSSRSRDGGPTLVPVSQGGSAVHAEVLVLENAIRAPQARAMLFRRESGPTASARRAGTRRNRWIATLADFAGLECCVYAALPANIAPLTATRLGALAVQSAAAPAGADRRDGISYLAQQLRRGVMTPLAPGYELAILTLTGTDDLDQAWAQTCNIDREP